MLEKRKKIGTLVAGPCSGVHGLMHQTQEPGAGEGKGGFLILTHV